MLAAHAIPVIPRPAKTAAAMSAFRIVSSFKGLFSRADGPQPRAGNLPRGAAGKGGRPAPIAGEGRRRPLGPPLPRGIRFPAIKRFPGGGSGSCGKRFSDGAIPADRGEMAGLAGRAGYAGRMRRTAAGLLLLLAGCTVQLGRDPANRFEVNPDFPEEDEPKTGKPESGAPSEEKTGDPDPQTLGPKPETPPDGLERNWRLGAEGRAGAADADPAKRYEALYASLRSDHQEAERLREIRAQSAARYLRRALRSAEEMEPLLSEADQPPFAAFLARYRVFCEEGSRLEGTLYRTESHRLASDLAARFAPGAVRLNETTDVPPPR